MGRLGGILVLLLGLVALSFAVKTALSSTSAAESAQAATDVATQPARGEGPTRPRRQLDNVREKSHELEKLQQEAADKAGAVE